MIQTQSSEIAKIMSASVAPVFLITGVAAILSIMALRYGRVIDRIRTLLRDGPRLYQKEVGADHLEKELKTLYKRARILRSTIIFEIISVFHISLTIFTLFFSLAFGYELVIGPLVFFIAGLIFLLIGLALFIQDFALSLACIENDLRARSNIDVTSESNASF
ncbi:MAG: DUF2721 domain-containing protein [Oligoflexus sp.]